ncbi:hypothetical protein ACLOJK_024833 [Asimina triloba]
MFFMGTRFLSSQTGAKGSSNEDALEGFSELDNPSDIDEVGFRKKCHSRVIVRAQLDSVHTALDEWVNKGKKEDPERFKIALQNLQKQHNIGKAMKLTEWVEANNHLNLTEGDYASLAKMIAKVSDPQQTERDDYKNAERVFDKMRLLGSPLSMSSYNQLLLLYVRHDWKKVAGVLLLMEEENVKPDLLTYHLLINNKGLENGTAAGIEPNVAIQATVARHYFHNGFRERLKADGIKPVNAFATKLAKGSFDVGTGKFDWLKNAGDSVMD